MNEIIQIIISAVHPATLAAPALLRSVDDMAHDELIDFVFDNSPAIESALSEIQEFYEKSHRTIYSCLKLEPFPSPIIPAGF